MEKQLLYLLDYNLAITEDEVVECAEHFLQRYTFDFATAPSPESDGLPVTPRLPSGPVALPEAPEVPSKAAARSRPQANVYDYDIIPPSLDRSDSSSTLGSEGPLTPRSQGSTPSPEPARITRATIQKPIPVRAIREPVHIADQDLPPFLASAGAAAKDARDSIVKRLFGRRREEYIPAVPAQ